MNDPNSATQHTDPYLPRPVDVADGIVAMIPAGLGAGTSNATLVIDGPDAIVVDTMLVPGLARSLAAELARRGATARTVVNTHAHIDHVGGNIVFDDARIVARPATADSVRRLAADTSFLPRLFPGQAGELADIRLRIPDSLDSSAVPLALDGELVRPGPAHTPADLAVWFAGPRVLVAGDLCGNGITPLALPGHASISGWIAALETLATLRPAVIVPGHGPVGGPELLAELTSYFAVLLTAARDAADAGIDVRRLAGRCRRGPLADWAAPERTSMNLAVAYAEVTGDTSGLPAGIPVASGPTTRSSR